MIDATPAARPRGARPDLSVVIPAFNEQARIEATLGKVCAFLKQRGLDAEVLVVDDGSTDRTAEVASRALRGRRGRVLRNEDNRGKGYAVRCGVREARGRWVLMSDSDLSTPIEEYERLAQAVREGNLDVAIGSRALAASRIEVHQHPLREWMGKTFNVLMRWLTGLPFRDTQCGFKLMDRERTLPLFEQMVVDGFAFDVELLFLCVRFGLRVGEVPVVWRNAPGSKVRLVSDPLAMLRDVVRVRWRWRRGAYRPQFPREPVVG